MCCFSSLDLKMKINECIMPNEMKETTKIKGIGTQNEK